MKPRILSRLAFAVATVLALVAPAVAQTSVQQIGCASTVVNCLQISGGTSGNPVVVEVIGADTNVSMTLRAKGTGTINISGGNIDVASSVAAAVTTSKQALAGDLTVAATATGHAGGYWGGVMGNLLGAALAATGMNEAGVIGKYSVTSTNASTYGKAAGLFEVGDGTTTADAAVLAVLGGDSAATTARAAFSVDWQNSLSMAVSYFNFGVDLQGGGSHDGYRGANFKLGDLRLGGAINGTAAGDDVLVFRNAGAPTSGASGTNANNAGPGSLLIDTTNMKLYINTNTKASPTWTVVGTQS